MGEVLPFDPTRRVRHRPPTPPTVTVELTLMPFLWPASFALSAVLVGSAITIAAFWGSAR